MDYQRILLYLLKLKTNLIKWYRDFRRRITDTESITIIDNNNSKNIIMRYYAIRLLLYFRDFIDYIKNSLEIETSHIQIIKDYPVNKSIFIIDSSHDKYKRDINITDMIEHVDQYHTLDKKHTPIPIFTKFSLSIKDGNSICLKKHIINYKDNHQYNSHTLDNILKFNNINIDTLDNRNPYIEISIMNIKGKKELLLPYNDVKNHHLNYFYNL